VFAAASTLFGHNTARRAGRRDDMLSFLLQLPARKPQGSTPAGGQITPLERGAGSPSMGELPRSGEMDALELACTVAGIVAPVRGADTAAALCGGAVVRNLTHCTTLAIVGIGTVCKLFWWGLP
jgi:hypothetical protein